MVYRSKFVINGCTMSITCIYEFVMKDVQVNINYRSEFVIKGVQEALLTDMNLS